MVKKLLYICHATSRFVIGCVFVFSFILTAQAQNLPDKPTKETSVYDGANLMSVSEKARLEQKLINYADSTSTQIL